MGSARLNAAIAVNYELLDEGGQISRLLVEAFMAISIY
jgi:hypothetical protein